MPLWCRAAVVGKHSNHATILATIAAGLTGVHGLRRSMTPRLASVSALTCPTVTHLYIVHRPWQSSRMCNQMVGMYYFMQVLWGGRTPSVTQALITPSTSMWASLDSMHAMGMPWECTASSMFVGPSLAAVRSLCSSTADPLPL